MLWIEKYRPRTLDMIVGQEEVVLHLRGFAEENTVPHMIISGPHGTGKSAAIECLARELYKETWQENTSIFSTSDLFSRGKTALQNNERFAHIFRKDASLITNFKYIVKWYASIRPIDAEFKLMVFEEASALTFEAQQALRRIMERYSATCRFIFCTTNQSGIIPAISSRCLPLFFTPLSPGEMASGLEAILSREGIGEETVDPDDLDLIIETAQGDLRRATMLLQLFVETGSDFDLADITQSEPLRIAEAAFSALMTHDFGKAQQAVQTLIIDYGLNGREVVRELRHVAIRDYNDPAIAIALADTDYMLGHAGNEFVQLDALLARIIVEVFD